MIFTGKLEDVINGAKDKEGKEDLKKMVDSAKEYPEGNIDDYANAFEWITPPSADVYDVTDKKIRENAYGYSKQQEDYYRLCLLEDEENNKKNPLSAEYIGIDKFSTNYIYDIGETFYRKYLKADFTVNSIQVYDTLPSIKEECMIPNMIEKVYQNFNEDGVLMNTKVKTAGELNSNQNIKYVYVSATITSYSNWVQDSEIIPLLGYFENNKDILKSADINTTPFIYIDGGTIESNYPLYIDNGFYSYNNPDIDKMLTYRRYPMRKGETLELEFMYIVPEDKLEEAYLYMNDLGHSDEYAYNSLGGVNFVKVLED